MLTISNALRLSALAVVLLAPGWKGASAQYTPAYTPPPPPLTKAPCVPTKKEPCAPPVSSPQPAPATDGARSVQPATSDGEKFPFPGDAPVQPAPSPQSDKFPFPGDSSAAPPSESPVPRPAGDTRFPFPGEAPATDAAGSSASSSSSSSSSASSSSSSSSSAAGHAPDPDAAAPAPVARPVRHRLPKAAQSVADREAEDLDVSRFYLQSGNTLAAYLRAQDAVKSIPDDPQAHLALAEAAQKMKKSEEAIAEYHAYLKLDPEGDAVKATRKALLALGAK